MLHSPISAHPSSEVITAPLCLHKYYSFIFLFCHDFFHQLDQSEKMTNIAVHHPEISSFKSTTQMVHAAHSHTLKSVTARLQSQYYLGGSSRTETARSTLATEQESSTPKWKGEKKTSNFLFFCVALAVLQLPDSGVLGIHWVVYTTSNSSPKGSEFLYSFYEKSAGKQTNKS